MQSPLTPRMGISSVCVPCICLCMHGVCVYVCVCVCVPMVYVCDVFVYVCTCTVCAHFLHPLCTNGFCDTHAKISCACACV